MSDKYNEDGSINENWLAEQIAEREGKEEEQNIAQIKETLKITLDLLVAKISTEELNGLLLKHKTV